MRTTSSPRRVISSPHPASHNGQVRYAVLVPSVAPMGAMLPPMRELFPEVASYVDPAARYAGDDRRAARAGRPWVLVNMITTVDGATAVEGRSGGLGGSADKRVFAAVRAVADVVLVGAGTVRAERYHAPRRRPDGSAPRLAIVTRSLDLDLDGPVFTADPANRPLVVTSEDADPARREDVAAVADVVVAGRELVDVDAALGAIAATGARVVVCEGGPSLNGHLVLADALDEVCLSVSPLAAGGRSPRVAQGETPAVLRRLRLDRVLEEDGYLFLRYVRDDGSVSGASGPSTS